MGLILCETRIADNPYYISELGIRIHTLEELAYFIFNYPYLSLDNFAGDRLVQFLNEELKLPVKDGTEDEILLNILYLSDYYSYDEIDLYKNKAAEIRSLKKHEFLYAKGDFLLSIEKYGKAELCFRNALKESEYYNAEDTFKSRVLKKRGCCFANMFDFESAFQSFKDALVITDDIETLKYIYFLSKFESNIQKKTEYLEYLDYRVNAEWDKEFEETVSESVNCEKIKATEKKLNTDSVKRHKFLEFMIADLKSDYRTKL